MENLLEQMKHTDTLSKQIAVLELANMIRDKIYDEMIKRHYKDEFLSDLFNSLNVTTVMNNKIQS